MYERLGVEEELAFGLVGQKFVGEPFRRSLLRVGGTEGEDEGGERLVRDPVRMAASREESQQVEMGGFRQGHPAGGQLGGDPCREGDTATIPGVEHPVVVGEAETQQGPFPEACGREARHYFRRPCPDRLAGRGGQLLTQYVEGDTRSLGEFLHPLVHGQRRAYETDLPEHLPYPPGVGSAFPPRRLPDAVAQVIHRLCPHEPAQRLGPLPAEHLVRVHATGQGKEAHLASLCQQETGGAEGGGLSRRGAPSASVSSARDPR